MYVCMYMTAIGIYVCVYIYTYAYLRQQKPRRRIANRQQLMRRFILAIKQLELLDETGCCCCRAGDLGFLILLPFIIIIEFLAFTCCYCTSYTHIHTYVGGY